MENEDQLNDRSRASSTSSNIEHMIDNYSQEKGCQLVFSPSMASKPNANNKNKSQKLSDDFYNFKLDSGSSLVEKSQKTKERAKSPTSTCNELIGSNSPKQSSVAGNSPNLGGNPHKLNGDHIARKKDKSATKQREKERENKLTF